MREVEWWENEVDDGIFKNILHDNTEYSAA
jgi:hypothetical protein